MSLFHMRLTLKCPHCQAQLLRVAPSEYLDLAVCPACLAAGPYDAIVEEGAAPILGHALPQDVQDYLQSLKPAGA